MNTASVKAGDVVYVNKKGRKFHAIVRERVGKTFHLAPIERNISYLSCSSREIEMAWHKSRQKSRVKSNPETEEADGD